MIGFFEHQYLSFKKNHLRNIIALAKSDGELHKDEVKLIYKLGHKYGLKDRQIERLITGKKELELNVPETFDEKMDQLYDVMQMVYADGVVDENEITFCNEMVSNFGYPEKMVGWLLDKFSTGVVVTPQEWELAKKEAKELFVKG